MATKTRRRPQTPKVGNTAYMKAMQELRRSNAAGPIPSGKKYNRNVKYKHKMFMEPA